MFRKFVALSASALMAAAGLIAMPQLSAPASAAPAASAFDPGLIISDSVFFDFGSMGVSEIQQFLDSRVSSCRATDPVIDCLKDIAVEIPDTPATTETEVGPCSAIPANPAASAAEVIYAVSVACGINPQVLITKLQKEQGLVTSTKPTSYMYRAAMGFGCPDSDPGICGKVYVGLFNQLYRAAKQLRWYGNPEGSFTYWKPGRTVSMRYHPKSSCGTKSFELKNQATANLYYYTPYTPNQAALANMYGSGDSCSAYGNRNFWRFFHDWFGSPIGGGYLLKSAGPETFLIVDDKKFQVSDSRLLAALRPLGPIGEISQAYLDSFTTQSEATQLVTGPGGGQNYLLVDGVKYLVSSCEVAAEFGLDCNVSIPLTLLQLNNFVDGGTLSRLVQTESGDRYWIESGASRLVVDDLALQTVGAQGAVASMMTIEQIMSVKPGAPLASESVIFTIQGSKQQAVATGGVTYLLNESFADEVKLSQWLDPVAGEISLQAIEATLATDELNGFVKSDSGETFVLTSSGKVKISDPANWTSKVSLVSDDFLSRVPNALESVSSPAVITFKGTSLNYLIVEGERRVSSDEAMVAKLLDVVEQTKAIQIPKSAVSAIKFSGEAFAPGSIIRSKNSSQLYLVDSLVTKIKLSGRAQASSTSNSKTFTVSDSGLNALATLSGFPTNKVQCSGETYLLDKGVLHPISPAGAAEFPWSPYAMSSAACASMTLAAKPVGQFIKTGGKIYLIQDRKKRLVASEELYQELRGDGPGYLEVSSYFAGRITAGSSSPKTVELASFAGTPAGNFGELSFEPASPLAVAPKPPATSESSDSSVSPAPAEEEDEPASSQLTEYRVVAGDSLGKIASRFGVSTKALQEQNGISNPNLIRIGQLLKIPSTSATTPATTPEPEARPTAEAEVEEIQLSAVEYRVKSGDTLLRIASRFGISSSSLQSFNSIANPNRISIGQLILIPTSTTNTNVAQANDEAESAPVTVTYTVSAGDTLWGISRKFGVSSSELASVNGINNANFIRVGQVLKVPN